MTSANRSARQVRGVFRAAAMVAATLVTATIALSPITTPTRAHAASQTSESTTEGSVGIRLVDIPAEAADDPRAQNSIVDELLPGTTIERRIEISNGTDSELSVQAYSAAAKISDGQFSGEEGRTANDLSSWTTLSDPEPVIAAGDSVFDTVTVTIPADAAPGEQYAAIWVEVGGNSDDTVQVVNRVGVRMYVLVGGDNPAASSFTVDTLTASRDDDGNPVVEALLHNTGGRALDASAELSLTAVGGTLSAGPYPAVKAVTIAPGETGTIQIAIADALDAGPWLASIEVTSGLLVQSFDAEVTFPDEGIAEAAPATPEESGFPFWLVTILSLGTLALVTLGASVILLTRKHRLAKKAEAERLVDAELS